jgi:phage I-like protein
MIGYDMDEEIVRLGYWVDLAGASFTEEDENVSWIQAVPVGSYDHPTYGSIEFTSDKIANMELNVLEQIRGQQLDIDYDHKSQTGKAAGWVTTADARADGLYLQVQWTKTAADAIKQGEYKYFSPEYQDKWKHPKTGRVHKDVLFGGALTNRPFLKDLLPVNLSELISDQGDPNMADDTFVTSMRDILGLEEDASEEAIAAALEDLVVQVNESPVAPEHVEEESHDLVPEPILASETADLAEITALAEGNPQVRALVDRVAILETANRLSEVNLKMQEWDTTRPYSLPAVLRDQARKILSETVNPAIEKFFDELTQLGMVPLGETKVASRGTERTAEESFTNLVNKRLGEDSSLGYADAVSQVSKDNPELFEDYRREAFQEVN